MPEEIVAITIIAIIAGTGLMITIASMLFSYLRARSGVGNGETDPQLTTSELERMLKRVVEEANEPLVERINALEYAAIGPEKSLPPKKHDSILDGLEDGPNDLAAVTKRQQGRQGVV